MKKHLLALGLAVSVVATGQFMQPSSVAQALESQASEELAQGTFLSANQALSYLKADKSAILIDIRSPDAINSAGMPADAAKNIPFKLSGNTVNPRFAADVDQFMQHRKNMSVFSTIILLCQSKTCAMKAVKALDDMGYDSVYTVPQEWQKNNLPWTKHVVPEKKYHVSSLQVKPANLR